MLIATLPKVYDEETAEKILSSPWVFGVRYNTGYCSPFSPKETLERVLKLVKKYKKMLWVDIEGRQLRITRWSYPSKGGKISVNREFDVDFPAQINFRGDKRWYDIKMIKGKDVFVSPSPKFAVGDGQTVNIRGKNISISGNYLTDTDKEYIKAAHELGIKNFMLSFVEDVEDIYEFNTMFFQLNSEIFKIFPSPLVLKIESLKGMEFVKTFNSSHPLNCQLMAACDDLFTNIGENKAAMLSALQKIIEKDSAAIVASKLFSGLESGGEVTLSDFSHLKMLEVMGYKDFMLSDGISHFHFDKAIKAWEDYVVVLRKESN